MCGCSMLQEVVDACVRGVFSYLPPLTGYARSKAQCRALLCVCIFLRYCIKRGLGRRGCFERMRSFVCMSASLMSRMGIEVSNARLSDSYKSRKYDK
jgi:hypothetical protein